MNIRQIRSIGGRGLGPEFFSGELRGIHVDGHDQLWAVGDSVVKLFDAQGKLLRQWKTEWPANCVTADAKRRVWLGGIGQIEIYSEEGGRLEVWGDPDRLGRVTSVGFAGEDILLADATHRCIRRYATNHRFLGDIGTKNNTRGFLIPNGHLDLAVGEKGIIHAANPGKYRIERYTAAGELLGHFGRFGTRDPAHFPGCCNPTNMALMSGGRVVVTEKAPPRLKVYDASGILLGLVGPEAFDANCKNMCVAVDRLDHLYVADTARLRIQVFSCGPAESRPAENSTGATNP